MPRRKAERPSRPSITARPELGRSVVKSAGRTLQILEFFDDIQREATVMEVAETLGFPQSSTSALLRSLAATGFLHYDPVARTYILSIRAALLGHWVSERLFRSGKLMSLMQELNQSTGDTVVLAARNGMQSQYIHVVQAISPARLHVTLGTVRPIAASGTGYALLSHLPDAEITRIVLRVNAEQKEPGRMMKPREVLDRVAEVRRDGYAFTTNIVTRGGGVLVMSLPVDPGQPPLVVGLAGISEVMAARKEELVALMREAIARHFRPGNTPAPTNS